VNRQKVVSAEAVQRQNRAVTPPGAASMSVERETRFAAASQHTTGRTQTARAPDCGTSRRDGSALPPQNMRKLRKAPCYGQRAVEVMRRGDLCRSHWSGRFVCG